MIPKAVGHFAEQPGFNIETGLMRFGILPTILHAAMRPQREVGHTKIKISGVDPEALSQELGPDYRIADFVALNRFCTCGAKWPQSSVGVGLFHTRGMRSRLRDARNTTKRQAEYDWIVW